MSVRSIPVLSLLCGWLLVEHSALAQGTEIAADALALAVRPAIVRLVGKCEGSYRLPDTGKSLEGSVAAGTLGTGVMVSTDGYVLTSDRVLQAVTSEADETLTGRERALVRQKNTPCEAQLRTAVASEFVNAIELVQGGNAGKLADVDYVRNQLQIQTLQVTSAVMLEDGRELTFQNVLLPSGAGIEAELGDLALLKVELQNAPALALTDITPVEGAAIARVGYPATSPEAEGPLNLNEHPGVSTASATAFTNGMAALSLPESDLLAGSPLFDNQGQLVALQIGHENNNRAAIASAKDIQNRLQAIDVTLTPTLDINLGGGVLPPVSTALETDPRWPDNMLWWGGGAGTLLVLLGTGVWLWKKRQTPSPIVAISTPAEHDASLPFLPPNLLSELDASELNVSEDIRSPSGVRHWAGRDRVENINLPEDSDMTRFLPHPVAAGSIGFISGELAGQQFDIPPEGLSIGRDGTVAQLVVDRPGISRKHVWIGRRDNRIVLMDYDSVNGTFLNDLRTGRVQGEVDLQPGDTVILADNAVQFRYFAEEITPDETILALGPSEDYGALICTQCVDRRMVGRLFRIPAEGLTVGRDATQAHIAIDSHEISKQHVWIGPIGDYVYAVDKGSLNGTYLNQLGTTSIREEKLTAGDTIVVSNSNVAQFRYSPPQALDIELDSDEETWFPDL
ncbi:MAG: FHA domain-containing protein [Cyanobacteria bacterium P01_D01_bin.123]